MMRLHMMLDETTAAPTVDLAAVTPQYATPHGRPAAAALVLFVGRTCRPGAADSDMLARQGMRSLWLPGLEQAIEAANMARFDALVLDASALEGRDGATLSRVRSAMQCPLVMLAEKGDEIDEILALELGADAYLLRPVAPRRLRAHLSVLMRLHHTVRPIHAVGPRENTPASVHDGDAWQLDRVANRLRRRDTSVALTEVQCAFLQCLIEARGRIVPRERLLSALPLGQAVHARSVDVYIHRLRKRLHDGGVFDLLIEAIRGRGYVLHTQA